jgi:protein kinase-like protein
MPEDSIVLGELAEEFTQRVRQGQLPQVEDYARRHPELAERIRKLFPTLMFLEGMAGKVERLEASHGTGFAGLSPGSTFGMFRIVGELGRGGMGIVYEAIHVPLDKRVALKILPVHGPRDARQLERFLREAKTAAGLHHTNIVPVFDIGQVQGVPYYAMQFIEGRGLDRVMQEGGLSASEPTTDLPATIEHESGAASESSPSPLGGRWVRGEGADAADGAPPLTPGPSPPLGARGVVRLKISA